MLDHIGRALLFHFIKEKKKKKKRVIVIHIGGCYRK